MNYTLTLTEQQVNLIANAVAALPWRDADPIMRTLTEQIRAQERPVDQAPKAPDPQIGDQG
jgi:hypothetical protein